MLKAPVKPELIRWACDRSLRDLEDLGEQFPKLSDWRTGDDQPTIKQLERFASATRTPFGYFFLASPPHEKLPIPDFRTLGDQRISRPSPDLLDTIYLCQQRQEWYAQDARATREAPLDFVGTATTRSDVVKTAAAIRDAVGLSIQERALLPTWEDALRRFVERADEAGVLVMVSGVVGHNSHRPLDPDEFRGFALADKACSLIFVNGADTKSAQMFTLAHELAHLWLGESGVSDITPISQPRAEVENWCNDVAAELLVPLFLMKSEFRKSDPLLQEVARLSRIFKVSTLVILRRIYDAGGMTRKKHWEVHKQEVARLRAILQRKRDAGGGGDYYLTTAVRVSKRFARAVLASTWEGRSTFTEAFGLLACKNVRTLEQLGDKLGMSAYLREGVT